jgi:hypothetical protein
MKKIMLVLLAMLMLSGCMASFPAKYDPKFSMNPSLGKDKVVNATCKFQSAFGKEVIDESIKLQTRVDKKIEEWGFTKDKSGRHLDITVKNVMGGGETALTVLTSVVCGLTLYIIPSVAIDKYRMTVIMNEEGKEPMTRQYNSWITTYQEIAFIIWGLIAYPIANAKWVAVDNMVDNLMNDLALTPEQFKERQLKKQKELELKRERVEREKPGKPGEGTSTGSSTGWGGPITSSSGTTKILTWDFATVWSGPGDNYPMITKARKGDKLIILGQSGKWVNVRLENGQEGWIRSEVLE